MGSGSVVFLIMAVCICLIWSGAQMRTWRRTGHRRHAVRQGGPVWFKFQEDDWSGIENEEVKHQRLR